MTHGNRRARILIVDDDPGLLHVVSRVLGHDYEVACFPSAEIALEAILTWPPDLAILDIYMPEMTGFDLMRQLTSGCRNLDVIIMTGDTAEPDSNLIRAIDEGAFYFIQKPFDRRVLQTLVGRCLELRRLRLDKQLQLQRMRRELDEARQFQASFLPPGQAEFNRVRIATLYLACQELAGDFFDYAEAGNGRLAALVADVVGHGASAAMMTAVVKTAFHACRAGGFQPSAVIERLQASLRVFDDNRFVTVFVARFDIDNEQVEYANAGHPPAILRRRDGTCVLLEPTGTLVSPALADIPCHTATVTMAPGDSLLVYSDGLAEAEGKTEMFGHARIRTLVAHSCLCDQPLLSHLLAEWSQFRGDRPLTDDVTVLAIELLPA